MPPVHDPNDRCAQCGDLVGVRCYYWRGEDDAPLCNACGHAMATDEAAKEDHLRYEAAWAAHLDAGGRDCR